MKTPRSLMISALAVLALVGLLITACSYNPARAPARPEPADSSEPEEGEDGVG